MPTFFFRSDDVHNRHIKITGALDHHLREVLRCQVGERLQLIDEKEQGYLGEVVSTDRSGTVLTLLDPIPRPPFSSLSIILGQALLKGENIDWVIRKGTELGIERVVPLTTLRTTVRFREERGHTQRERWQRIAQEAAQQSERWTIPEIETPQTLHDFIHGTPRDVSRLILWEKEPIGSGKRIFQEHFPSKKVFFLVGPEGGFEEEEVREALNLGFLPVSLGPRTLRAETAAISFLALLQHHWGDLG